MRASILPLVLSGCIAVPELSANDLAVAVVDAGDAGETASGPPAPECDVLRGTGCATGHHCGVGIDDGMGDWAIVCLPDGDKTLAEGESCGPFTWGFDLVGDLCKPGLVCADAGFGGRCLPPCFSHADCAGGACVAITQASGAEPDAGTLPLGACLVADGCDPPSQSGCAKGQRCALSPSDGVARVARCVAALGALPSGAGCDATSLDGSAFCASGDCALAESDGGNYGACK